MTDLIAYLNQITNVHSDQELWRLHVDRMARYGFDRLLYGYTRYRTRTSLGDPEDMVLLSNHTRAYMDGFMQQGHYQQGPMVRWALENDGACSWRWMEDLANADLLTENEKRVVKFNQDNNVRAGYTFSFRSVSRRTKGAIALTARAGMSQDEVEAVWAEHGNELIAVNNVMHLKLHTLPYSGARPLTKRQREVLQWVGDGKTTQDIAILLDLTPATVEKHLRLAREALDVETTAQAVLKAAFYNQMFILDV